jgi:hypothetical protein
MNYVETTTISTLTATARRQQVVGDQRRLAFGRIRDQADGGADKLRVLVAESVARGRAALLGTDQPVRGRVGSGVRH